MLQQPNSLLLYQLGDHITQYSADGIETFIGVAYISKARIVKKDFLHNEDSYGLAQLRPGFHDSETQWNNFGCQKKINDFR